MTTGTEPAPTAPAAIEAPGGVAIEKINAAEVAAGEPLGKPRVKAVRHTELLKFAGQ